jgi:hypothetical protein
VDLLLGDRTPGVILRTQAQDSLVVGTIESFEGAIHFSAIRKRRRYQIGLLEPQGFDCLLETRVRLLDSPERVICLRKTCLLSALQGLKPALGHGRISGLFHQKTGKQVMPTHMSGRYGLRIKCR